MRTLASLFDDMGEFEAVEAGGCAPPILVPRRQTMSEGSNYWPSEKQMNDKFAELQKAVAELRYLVQQIARAVHADVKRS